MQNANAVIPKGCKHSLETEPIVKHEAALKYLQVTRINISKLLKSSSDLQRSVFIATEKQLLWNVWKFFLTLDTKISFHPGIELFYFFFCHYICILYLVVDEELGLKVKNGGLPPKRIKFLSLKLKLPRGKKEATWNLLNLNCLLSVT